MVERVVAELGGIMRVKEMRKRDWNRRNKDLNGGFDVCQSW